MNTFFVSDAFDYYTQHIHRQERFKLLKEHNFPITGSVHPVDWELFGSILTGDTSKHGYGSDLSRYEVKSAVDRASFEYQYHLLSGQEKLEEDMRVDHIFISYSTDYSKVVVRVVLGEVLAPTFRQWKTGLEENYKEANRRQRFRKSIAFGVVARIGTIVMAIESQCLVFP